MKRKISILGSTGSIGRQALEVIDKLQDKFEIIALTGGANTDLLNQQIAKFKPKYAYSSGAKAEICLPDQAVFKMLEVSRLYIDKATQIERA